MTKAQRNELEYIQMAKGVTYFLARNNPAKVSMLKRMAAKNYITFTEEPAGIADCYISFITDDRERQSIEYHKSRGETEDVMSIIIEIIKGWPADVETQRAIFKADSEIQIGL